ncbi:MAG: hypothetical protein MUF39_12480 [Cyclobacteriaceae bacterium]|nr:hypothetical protein [Cyclobacteriaceae bacterium]
MGTSKVAYCQNENFGIKIFAGVYSANFSVPDNTYINDTTFTYMSVPDDVDILIGADFYYNFLERTGVYGEINFFLFNPTANIKMGQTINTSNGPIIVYDSWGTSYSFLRANITGGLSQRITEFVAINGGIGLNFNIPTAEPFIGNNPGKFFEIANALRPIYRKTNTMYQIGVSFNWRKISLNINYQSTFANETERFILDNATYAHQSRLGYWTISLGYEIR